MFETWLKSDLKKPVEVKDLDGYLFTDDNEGNLIGVEIYDDGEEATGLSGTVYGYIIRQDGVTVVLTGTLTNNKAYIVLPLNAYKFPGKLSIVIKSGACTVGACVASVYRSSTNRLVDPEEILPSIEELEEMIEGVQQDVQGISEDVQEISGRMMSDNIVSSSSSTTHNFTFPAGSRNLVIFAGSGGITYLWIGYVYVTNNGAVSTAELYKGSRVSSVSSSADETLKITLTQAAGGYLRSVNAYGGVPS